MKSIELIQVDPYSHLRHGPTTIFLAHIVRFYECRICNHAAFTSIDLPKETIHVDGDYARISAFIKAAAQ